MLIEEIKFKLKKNHILKKIYIFSYKFKENIVRYIFYIWVKICIHIPIKNNKIVICNYFGKAYGDNGKYIAEEIIKQGIKCDIVWLLNKELIGESEFPSQIRISKYNSIRGLYELATSKIWIDNCRKSYYTPKRKEQFYIQTWHGGIVLKQVEKDAEKSIHVSYVKEAKHDSQIADLFISNSKFCTNMYKHSFWYDGRILECGSPRCDILINKNDEADKKVRKFFNIMCDTHIAIYAPTFRVDHSMKAYDIDFNMVIKELENKFAGKWIVMVRLHPNMSSKDKFIQYNSDIINATNYDDMYELLVASDILITDYSSTMFEFSLTYKPVFLYAKDINDYIKDRNLYFDIHSLPYSVSADNSQLCNNIEEFDEDKYKNELNAFLSKIGIVEKGNASKKVVKVVNEIISRNITELED